MLAVARGRSRRAIDMRWLYEATWGILYGRMGRVSVPESLGRLWSRASSAMAGRWAVYVYRTTDLLAPKKHSLSNAIPPQGLSEKLAARLVQGARLPIIREQSSISQT